MTILISLALSLAIAATPQNKDQKPAADSQTAAVKVINSKTINCQLTTIHCFTKDYLAIV